MNTPTTSRSELALLPPILTAFAVVIAAGLAAIFPLAMVALYVAILPVPLILLWAGRDVPAPLDTIAAVDAERAHAKSRAPERVAPPLARAA